MSVLALMIKPKTLFDPCSKKHITIYKNFLRTHSWGVNGCPFVLQFPYLTIPDMIKDKMIHKLLGIKRDDYRSWML
jgi:hypothetical protein